MPIPKNECDMAGEGWFKELTIKKVTVKGGVVYCEEWDFYANTILCTQREGGRGGPPCGTDHVYLKCQNGKLLWCCFKHKRAMGPISFGKGARASVYPISAIDGVKICEGTGQEIPETLKTMAATEKARSDKTRRRPSQTAG